MQFHNFTVYFTIVRLIPNGFGLYWDNLTAALLSYVPFLLLPETLRVKAKSKRARACHTFSGHLRHQHSSRRELHTALQLNSQEKPSGLSVMISLRSHPVPPPSINVLPANVTDVYRILSFFSLEGNAQKKMP